MQVTLDRCVFSSRSERVEKAKALLMNSPRAFSDVALACGFADQSHFTRTFQRVVGISPDA